MEVIISEKKEKVLVTIECPAITPEIRKLKDHILAYEGRIWASQGSKKQQIPLQEILYFESVDNKTFLYTQKQVLEIPQRLYELEDSLKDRGFFRCSKSVIVNLNQIQSLQPEINRTILAYMNGGDRITISRRYVKALLEILSL